MNGFLTYSIVTGLVAGGIWVGTIQVQVAQNTDATKKAVETHEKVIRMDERQKQILSILKELRNEIKKDASDKIHSRPLQ